MYDGIIFVLIGMTDYICPKCGKNDMVKQKTADGRYVLICQSCGFKRGSLPTDKKKDIV